jgi:hypothetical protein
VAKEFWSPEKLGWVHTEGEKQEEEVAVLSSLSEASCSLREISSH